MAKRDGCTGFASLRGIAWLAGMLLLLAFHDLGAQSVTPSYTAEQAERGQASYEHSCQACHGSSLDNGDFGGAPLRGSWFRTHWGSTDAGALFLYIKSAMPPDNPGSLNDTTLADICHSSCRETAIPPARRNCRPTSTRSSACRSPDSR